MLMTTHMDFNPRSCVLKVSNIPINLGNVFFFSQSISVFRLLDVCAPAITFVGVDPKKKLVWGLTIKGRKIVSFINTSRRSLDLGSPIP